MTTLPYRNLIHIGCGAQPDVTAYRARAEHVWLIDADAERITSLQETLHDIDSVHLQHALVDVGQRLASLYRYSLPWADGLTPLDEATRSLYPGLRCLGATELQTVPVDALVAQCLGPVQADAGEDAAQLLILDVGRHNAALLEALEHSGALARFSTVAVVPAHRRDAPVAVPPSLHGPVATPSGLSLPDNSQILARHPLLRALQDAHAELQVAKATSEKLAVERDLLAAAENALTRARDEQTQLAAERATQLEALTHAKATADKLSAERQAQLDALTKEKAALAVARDAALKEKEALTAERDALAKAKTALTQARDEQTQLAAERQAQLDALTKEKAALAVARDAALKEKEALTAERDALAKARTALTQARDEQTQLAAERATQLEALTHAKATAEKLAAERQAQLDTLTKEKAALAAARDAALKEKEALSAERDALAKAKTTLTTERDALKQTIAEGQYRQALLEEEMVKANAQLELIKDLLLQEPGL